MWIMEKMGYTSTVVHRDDPDTLLVRSRDRQSLVSLLGTVFSNPDEMVFTDFPSDYPYRAMVSRTEYKEILCALVDEMDYDNFKNEAKKLRGKVYADFLMSVWSTSHDLTPPEVQKKNRGW